MVNPHPKSAKSLMLVFLLILSLACALPGLPRLAPAEGPTATSPQGFAPAPPSTLVSTPEPTDAPRPTPTPLPPALVESDPPPGSEISLTRPITFYFNQPMERASVEGALSGQPPLSGRFNWLNDSAVTFIPDVPLLPETDVTITVSATAQSKRGLTLLNPLTLKYRTVGYLRLSQGLPEADAQEVDPSSAVVATFNRPVVPLGTEPEELPAALSLEPAVAGQGEWINTSTYIFYPKPAMAGGVRYTVHINPELSGVDGSPLDLGAGKWSFTTALPRLVSFEPDFSAEPVRLDAKLVLTFNQAMDAQSVSENFSLRDPADKPVPGEFVWSENGKILTFTPLGLLKRNTTYTLTLSATAQALGGTPLGSSLRAVFTTVKDLAVLSTQPVQGGVKKPYDNVLIYLTAHLAVKDPLSYLSLSPEVTNLGAFLAEDQRSIFIYGDFAPSTDYTLTISADLADPWGGRLGQPFMLNFRTAPLDPNLVIAQGYDLLYLTPQKSSLPAQATNLPAVTLSLGSVPFQDFVRMLGPGGYEFRQNYRPGDARSWTQRLALDPDRSRPVELDLAPEGGELAPGIYMLRVDTGTGMAFPPILLVVSRIHLTFKLGATDALVWAVDLSNRRPAANLPAAIYEENGSPLALGITDAEGIFRGSIPSLEDPYRTRYAMIGQPGEENFGMALSTWSQGVQGWDFGIPVNYEPPGLKVYLYTDRPIYRPGQTVYFRVIARQADNGRYSLPKIGSLPLKVYNELGLEVASIDLSLSALGTAHGEYTLPTNAQPGDYRLGWERYSINFRVADYRKPEINLQVSFDSDEALVGQSLSAMVEARYFFDVPASDVPVRWSLYVRPASFDLPGYQVGIEDMRWLMDAPLYGYPVLGVLVKEGTGQTGSDGRLVLNLPPELTSAATLEKAGLRSANLPRRLQVTLEVTATDESGLPVSGRDELSLHPAPFYIGVRPDAWVIKAGDMVGFEVQLVDWAGYPAGVRTLRADFRKVIWLRDETRPFDPFGSPRYTAQYTLVGQTDFVSSEMGNARLAFTPLEPGTYQLIVSGEAALTEITLWVGGPGQVVWPNLPNGRLRLTADQESYRPGDTAQIFIPNPLGADALALVTVERGKIMQHQVLALQGTGASLSLPLGEDEAPNVFLAVTLLGSGSQNRPEFRQGYLNLSVEPVKQVLNVSLTRQPERTGPGEQVTFFLRVTDASGQPVQGEFSLSVVDLAVLALADPNAPDIVPAFYGKQPLGVRTALDLAADPWRLQTLPNGIGGGGGGEGLAQVVRENFPDTAYWNAEIVTDLDGNAQVTVSLPDTLTTWQVLARGVTADTRVGQAQTDVITTKELLVRPVTPRFLVAGDHALLAAIVQNNTNRDLQVDVSLQTTGFDLDEAPGDAVTAARQVNVRAGGRTRVEWWGTAQQVDSVDLVFTARAGELEDAARPARGALPVLRYVTPQTFATVGVLEEQGQRLELISLPRRVAEAGLPIQGNLKLELAPSLAAAILDDLEVLERHPYQSTEGFLSRFMPNLVFYRALQFKGIDSPEVSARLDRTLDEGLQRLAGRQNADGGWGWWTGADSDLYLTAYVLFGLSYTQQAGVRVDPNMIQRAVDYLYNSLYVPNMVSESWQIDRLAMAHFALAWAGRADPGGLSALYEERVQLSAWAQALLALSISRQESGDARASTLLSDLQATALRSSSGIHWEDSHGSWQNMSSPVMTTAVVVYGLAQLEPASTLLPDAVRYLMAHRQAQGGWLSAYETAWTLISITEFIQGTGELAGNFSFSAALNDIPVVRGQVESIKDLNTVQSTVSAEDLFVNEPNVLQIRRSAGSGRLYYRAFLDVASPVEAIPPLNRGFTLARTYHILQDVRSAVQSARVGDLIMAKLTLIVPNDAYYLLVEDYIPAGAEILDTRLKTSQQGVGNEPGLLFDPLDPFASGWGWWYFHPAQIYDQRIVWAADYLPAGTYELVYTLAITQPGEYRVLPARAWQFYYPEVQGSSAGAIFEIRARER